MSDGHKDAHGRTLAPMDSVRLRRGGTLGVVVTLGPKERITVRWDDQHDDLTADPSMVERVLPEETPDP